MQADRTRVEPPFWRRTGLGLIKIRGDTDLAGRAGCFSESAAGSVNGNGQGPAAETGWADILE